MKTKPDPFWTGCIIGLIPAALVPALFWLGGGDFGRNFNTVFCAMGTIVVWLMGAAYMYSILRKGDDEN